VQSRALVRHSTECIRGAVAHLLEAQDADGLWRDYALAPGCSEAWTTAWVAWCLTHFGTRPSIASAVRRAAIALERICTPVGWGYNREAIPDADSTGWAVRFLCAAGVRPGDQATSCVAEFLDSAGRAHTFRGADQGTWSDAHADVTAIVGLALLACGADGGLIQRTRSAVVNAQRADGLWTSFWWATDAYAALWSVQFLDRTGGLNPNVRNRLTQCFSAASPQGTGLENALWLSLAIESRNVDLRLTEALVACLIEAYLPDGWPGSALLLDPPRFSGDAVSPAGPHSDVRGLISTAMACWALARWAAQ